MNQRIFVPEFPSFAFAGAVMDRVCACAPAASPASRGRHSNRWRPARRRHNIPADRLTV